MLDLLKALVLGIVEGITEFLPISSTGHLILVNQFLDFHDPFTHTFDIVIQLGAIGAVIVYFWARLFPFKRTANGWNLDQNIISLWFKAVVGVLPALLIGGLLGKKIQALFFNPFTVAIALIIGGLIILAIERKRRQSTINSLSELSYLVAVEIGFIQCLAMIPGTSRSAATIIGAMLLGASRLVAAEYSFFLAIPTMVAASAYAIYKTGWHLTTTEWWCLAVGFGAAFFTAWAVIALFMNYIRHHSFRPFGYYRIALGLVVLVSFLVFLGR